MPGFVRVIPGDCYFYRDDEISELKDAFNSMSIKLKEEIELKNKIDENRKQLVLDMAHDLKNPITSALGYSELLLSKNISAEEVTRYSKIIFNNCKRANMLAVSLFEFSRLQSDGFNLNLIEEDICEFVRELIADYLPKIEDKGLLYDFSIPERALLLKFDKSNLYRAISNILDNCIKYNKSGTQIGLNLNQINNTITIIIKDNGCGISKEIIPTILDPFIRVDKARNSETGGTGLGLSIADMIIKKHGGTLEVQSDINKGCKFILELPIILKSDTI
jgi:signal transduction histidine kinase